MNGGQYEQLQEWQRKTKGRRVDITLDYRQWEEKYIERIMVFDEACGLFWTIVKPEDIDNIDAVIRERSMKLAQEAVAENMRILDGLVKANEAHP